MKPWVISRSIGDALHDPTNGENSLDVVKMRTLLGRTIYLVAEAMRNASILLQPFMPEKAKEMLDVLGVSGEKRTFEYVGLRKDFSYGSAIRPLGRSAHESLFPPLPVQQ